MNSEYTISLMSAADPAPQSSTFDTSLGILARGAEADLRTLLTQCANAPDAIAGNVIASRALTGFLQLFAALAAAATDGVWREDRDYPGYVRLSGSDQVAAPYHIAAHFPVGGELAPFLALARAIRIDAGGSQSTICLSGSAAMLGAIAFHGDIDFCEYLDGRAADQAALSIADHCHSVSDSLACLNARIVRYIWQPGGDSRCDPEAVARALRDIAPGKRQGKMDFMATLGNHDAAEASNVLIWLDPDTRDDTRGSSFSQQEAPVDGSGWMPRRLDEPAELGAYVRFLLRQIETFVSDSPIKAAKRALSLAFLFHLGPDAEALTDILDAFGLVADDAACQRKKSAARAIATLGPHGAAFAERALAAAARLDPGLSAEAREMALDRVREHVRAVRDAVGALLQGGVSSPVRLSP